MSWVRTFTALILALLVLVASVGVTVNDHVCGGQIQSTAIFFKADLCGMMEMGTDVPEVKGKAAGCCDDQTKIFKTSEDNAETAPVAFAVPTFLFVAKFIPDFEIPFSRITDESFSAELALDKPPLPERDIVVLVRSFLI